MKRATTYLISLAIAAAIALSCQRKEIEPSSLFYAHIPISLDWSNSLLDLSDVGNVSIYFYPVDGGDPVVNFSSDLYYKLVELPIGEYNVLVFNDLVYNIKGVDFDSPTSYDDFTVSYVENNIMPNFYDMAADEVLSTEHSRVASWSYEGFGVDISMVEYTRSTEFESYIEEVRSKSISRRSATSSSDGSSSDAVLVEEDYTIELPVTKTTLTKSATRALEEFSNVVPEPVTTILDFRVRVLNLNNAAVFETSVRGMTKGAYLSSREKFAKDDNPLIYNTTVTNREYDDPDYGIDGYVNFSLNTFGRVQSDDENYSISFRVILHTGEMASYERDITDQMISGSGGTIDIDLTDSETLISLTEYSEPGFGVTGWGDDVIINL